MVAALAAALVTPAQPALAALIDPGDVAAVDVYREEIPTATGAVVRSTGGESLAPLPPAAKRALRAAGPAAADLERVARSSLYGAPDRAFPRSDTLAAADVDEKWTPQTGAAAVWEALRRSQIGLLSLLLALVTGGLTVVRWRRSTAGRRVVTGHREASIVRARPDDAR